MYSESEGLSVRKTIVMGVLAAIDEVIKDGWFVHTDNYSVLDSTLIDTVTVSKFEGCLYLELGYTNGREESFRLMTRNTYLSFRSLIAKVNFLFDQMSVHQHLRIPNGAQYNLFKFSLEFDGISDIHPTIRYSSMDTQINPVTYIQ